MPEANRLLPDWNLDDEESPELGLVHRRVKTHEIFDLAESAYLGLRRAAHCAETVADAAAVADSDDDSDDDGAPPPPPRQQLASETTSK